MAAIQSLEQFKTSFAPKPVEVELTGFARDGASSEEVLSVFLKPLTSRQRDDFEMSVAGLGGAEKNLSNLRARLVALCWVDEAGKPIGTADEIGDLSSDLVSQLFDQVRKLNHMDADDIEEAGKD